MLGDIALERMLALGVGYAGAKAEIRDARSKGLQAVQLDQVEVVGDAVDQVQRMLAALFGDFLQHRGERRQPGTTGQQQQRPTDLAQVETAQRAGQGHAVARLGKTGKKAAHQAARHVADQKADLTVLLQRAEGIGASMLTAGHAEVDVLPRQKSQTAQGLALDRQGNGAVGQLAHGADAGLIAGLLGLAQLRRSRHTHHAIALGAHLAGQHIALGGFFLAQGVFDVFLTEVVTASFGETLTGTAGAVAAIQRNVDALAVSGIGHAFVSGGVDETGDPVLEIQGDLVHGAPRSKAGFRCDKRR
ncbi:hypothetical protein D3C81_1233700 [compost metagenome]